MTVELTLWKAVPYFMQCRYGLQTLPIGSNISGPCLAILNFGHNTPLCILLQTLSFLQNFHPEYSGIEIVMMLNQCYGRWSHTLCPLWTKFCYILQSYLLSGLLMFDILDSATEPQNGISWICQRPFFPCLEDLQRARQMPWGKMVNDQRELCLQDFTQKGSVQNQPLVLMNVYDWLVIEHKYSFICTSSY